MTQPSLQSVLQLVASAYPEPLYPASAARRNGLSREGLDDVLDQLRIHGLVALTEWVSGHGQGFELTEAGADLVSRPAALARLTPDNLPRQPVGLPADPAGWDGDGDPTELHTRPVSDWARAEIIRDSLVNPRSTPVTWILLALNVAMYVVCRVYADRPGGGWNRTLDVFGQIDVSKTLGDGEWWRVLSSTILHGGFIHLLMNMFSLFMLGPISERVWGSVRFAVIYLLSGVGGAFLAMYLAPERFGVGASGCIWGLMTSLFVWVTLNKRHLPPGLVSAWSSQLVVVLLINGAMSFTPGISWQAHFGGGAVGALAAVLLNLERFGSNAVRWVMIATLCILPLALMGELVRQRDALLARAKNVRPDGGGERRRPVDRDQPGDGGGGGQDAVDVENRELAEFNSDDEEKPGVASLVVRDGFKNDLETRIRRRIESVLGEEPANRDPKQVDELLDETKRIRDRVTTARDKLDALPKFQTERIEQVRQAGAARLKTAADYWSYADDSLRQKTGTLPELNKKTNAWKASRDAWSKFFEK